MALNIKSTIPEEFTEFDPKKQEETIYDIEGLKDDDDKEIWLIRVPQQVKADSLKTLSFKYPKTAGKPLQQLKLNDNKDTFTMYKVPEGKTLEADVGISGQEMLGFTCLLPSKDNQGKLGFAPKKITNYLILDEEVTIPDGTQLSESIRDTPITKREHPEGLQMRFKPYGYYTRVQKEESKDTDMINDDNGQEKEEEKKIKKAKKVKKETIDDNKDQQQQDDNNNDDKKNIKVETMDDNDDEVLKRKRTVGDDDDENNEQEKKKKKKKEKKEKKDKKEKKEKKIKKEE